LAWIIDFNEKSRKQLKKLSRQAQSQILNYLEHKVATLENPRSRGDGMTANYAGFWRYRVEDYRIICKIEDEKVTILVVKLGHRREVYE